MSSDSEMCKVLRALTCSLGKYEAEVEKICEEY